MKIFRLHLLVSTIVYNLYSVGPDGSPSSDKELLNRLQNLVKQEHDLTLEILSHIAEVDRRELYLYYGYGSLSEYCVSFLGYGESSAWRRVAAARVIRKYPEVYALLRDRKLTFSAVLLLAKVINSEGKCEYVAPNGKRCDSIHNLQYYHYPIPFARGGPAAQPTI